MMSHILSLVWKITNVVMAAFRKKTNVWGILPVHYSKRHLSSRELQTHTQIHMYFTISKKDAETFRALSDKFKSWLVITCHSPHLGSCCPPNPADGGQSHWSIWRQREQLSVKSCVFSLIKEFSISLLQSCGTYKRQIKHRATSDSLSQRSWWEFHLFSIWS